MRTRNLLILLPFLGLGCGDPASDPEAVEQPAPAEPAEAEPEGPEAPPEPEGPVQLAIGRGWDSIHDGARLVLSYDGERSAFVGSVVNTTEGPLERVSVRILLSSEVELGPTPPASLGPGEHVDLELPAAGKRFEWWSPAIDHSGE